MPTCPDWTVRDLILHIGGVHRWAATYVRDGHTEPIAIGAAHEIDDYLPVDAELVTWFRTGLDGLVAAIETAPADVACWSFLPAPSPLAFWARRQAHETTIHRVDAESAAGAITPVDPAVASDGIDELLTGFVVRPKGRLRSEEPRTLAVHTTDTDAHWLLTVSDQPVVTDRANATADTVLRGPAHDVYLALWNRLPLTALEDSGDQRLIDEWPTAVRIRWT